MQYVASNGFITTEKYPKKLYKRQLSIACEFQDFKILQHAFNKYP